MTMARFPLGRVVATPRTPVPQRCASARGARRREQRLPDLLEHVGPVGQPDHRRQVLHNEPSLLARCPKLKHVAVHPVIQLFRAWGRLLENFELFSFTCALSMVKRHLR